MLFGSELETSQILDVLVDEVGTRGGRVTEKFDDGRRLFARSVLDHFDEVKHGDRVRGGVALKAMVTGTRYWKDPALN